MSAANKVPDNLNYLSNISFRLTMEDSPNITWFCQAVNIPGVSIDGLDVQTPHATVPFGGSKVSFEELTVRFIVDEHMKNWSEIYNRIIAMGLAEGHENFKKLQDNTTMHPRGGAFSTIVLTILTSGMNPQMEFHFYDAFPISLSALDFDSSVADVEFFQATASFRYVNYEVKNLLNN